MLEQLQSNPIAIIVLLAFFALYFVWKAINKKLRNGAEASDDAYIGQSSYNPSAMGPMAGVFTQLSNGAKLPLGTLELTVMPRPLRPLPEDVDVKVLVIDENKHLRDTIAQLPVQNSGVIGTARLSMPFKPYGGELLCKAWIVKAYYSDGRTWRNDNADKYEAVNTKYLNRRLKKLK